MIDMKKIFSIILGLCLFISSSSAAGKIVYDAAAGGITYDAGAGKIIFTPSVSSFSPLSLSPEMMLDTEYDSELGDTDQPLMTVRRVTAGDEVDIYGWNPSDPRQYKTMSEAIGSTTGSELITNGDFTTDLTGWSTLGSPSTIEATGGEAHIVGVNDNDGIAFGSIITSTIGNTYVIEFDYRVISGSMEVILNSTANVQDFLTDSGSFKATFVAGTTNIKPLFRQNGATATEFYIDNVTIKEWTGGYYETQESKLYPTEEFHVVTWYDQSLGLGSELVTNGNMELDSNWNDRSAPVTNERSATQAHVGTYSRKLVVDGQFQGVDSDTDIAVVAGKYYKATAWIYGDSANKLALRLSAGVTAYYPTISDTTGGNIFATGWTKVDWVFKATGTENLHADFFSGAGMTAGTFYIDDVSVKEIQGNHATNTTAASQPELIWEGATFGSELVTNGDFTVSTGWSPQTGWSISGGKATCDGTNGAQVFTNIVALDTSKLYKVSIDVLDYTSGSVRSIVNNRIFGTMSSNGNYSFYNKPVSGITANAASVSFIGSIDNYSVKEVLTWNYPTLKFDGVDDYLTYDLFNLGDKSIVLGIEPNTAAGTQSIWSLKSNSNAADIDSSEVLITDNGSYQPYSTCFDFTTTTNSVGIADSVDLSSQLLIVTYNGGINFLPASYTINKDGTNKTVLNSASFNRSANVTNALGGRLNISTLTAPYRGKIKNVILYDSVLTPSNISDINTYYTP